MKISVSLLMVMAFLSIAPLACADDNIPSFVGKWKTESIGGMLLHEKEQGKSTHWAPDQKVLKGEIDVTKQDGRLISGVYTSERAAEKFIGMISSDGKSFYASDSDGYWDCKLLDDDTIEILYRHVKPTDSVVAMGVGKREK